MGNSLSVDGRAPIHMFTSSKAWIEGNATRQLEQVARMDGVSAVAAMPDLHPGKFGPVGCAILSRHVHPALIGADIGCGMGLFQLDLAARKLRADTAAKRLRALGDPSDADTAALLDAAGLAPTPFDGALGTVGGGNHFCELQAIEDILDADAAARAGLDRDKAFLLVHSGSRGLGFSVLEDVLAHGTATLDPAGEAGRAYLARHDHAVAWARLNRETIASRASRALRADTVPITDVSHNLAEPTAAGVLHRKGTAPADRGLVPVPGSRGSLSYLVEPRAAARVETLASLAHGAGRKYERGSMHGRVGATRTDLDRLARNPFGGLVVCEDRTLLVEEAPEAYKSIEAVIADLVGFGLARVVATFRPIVTFKAIKDEEMRPRRRERRFRDNPKWEDRR